MIFISDTNLHTVNVRIIEVIQDCQFEVLDLACEKYESASAKLADATNPITFLAGSKIIGTVTQIKLKSGVVICY